MDRGTWQATVQRLTESQTQLTDLSIQGPPSPPKGIN